MPQPFPRHLKKSEFEIGYAVRDRPMLCLMGMNVITQYVSLETSLSILFTTLLGANPGPAVAMMTTIKNNNIRTEAFRAVAESALATENLELLNAVLAACETADKERNRIAHWVWATEKQLPDAIVLLDPKKVANVQAKTRVLHDRNEATIEEIEAIIEILRSAAMVYKVADFESAFKHVQQAMSLVITLNILLAHPEGHPEGAKARQMLLAAPEIKQWLARPSGSNPPRNAQ